MVEERVISEDEANEILNATIKAEKNIAQVIETVPTPLIYSHHYSNLYGATVYLKLEIFHLSRSFKIRGVINFLMRYKEKHGTYPSKVVTASGGNHGVAVSVACYILRIPCQVFLPTISAARRVYVEKWNGKVEVVGSCFSEANVEAKKMCAEDPSIVYIHPYDDPYVMEGQGTITHELLTAIQSRDKDGKAPDILFAACGGGGLLAGMASHVMALRTLQKKNSNLISEYGDVSKLNIVPCESIGCDYFYESWLNNKLVTLPSIKSICLTLAASTGSDIIFSTVMSCVSPSPNLENSIEKNPNAKEGSVEDSKTKTDTINNSFDVPYRKYEPIRVTDKEAVEAVWDFLDKERIMIEPSCAVSIAGLKKLFEANPAELKGKKIVVLVCGSGADINETTKHFKNFGLL